VMKAVDALKDWLKAHGYDGLSNCGCGCNLEDFAPCQDGPYNDCLVARDVGPKNGFGGWMEPVDVEEDGSVVATRLRGEKKC